jgi:cytochrome c biogenesis protein CcdA/thiol-disulfide isomerase/thioredoxin
VVVLVLVAFVVGAGTALSPCALPVLPGLLSATATGGRRRPLGVVLGLSITFLVTIALTAAVLRHIGLGGSELRWFGIAVLAIAGVATMVPWLADRLERPLARLARLGPRERGSGFGTGLLVGAGMGFVYAPCAGPVLAAVISVSAVSGRTFLIAVAYVLGSALVLLAIAAGGRRVLAPIRRAGAGRVQRLLGAVLLATAVVMAIGLDTDLETSLARHTADITLTAGLEQSRGVQDRLAKVHGAARFTPAAGAAARLPVLGTAPAFTGTQRWFNTPGDAPLTLAGLRGRVVLIDFWTYTCINCLRTLPYLEAWDRRYRADGLTIVGVHSPEFGFEHDAGNVRRAIAANGIAYPVVQDNDLATWTAWGNEFWPADYLVDARGRVRAAAFGEGGYDKTEGEIRSLLAERGEALAARRARPTGITPVDAHTTPETYLGVERAQGWTAKPQAGEHTYAATPAAALALDAFSLGGAWTIGGQPATAGARATIDAHVQARFVYLVLAPPSAQRPGSVTVTVDGGRPHRVRVTTQRLYTLVRRPADGAHRIHLAFGRGTAAYAFTFG